MPEIVSSHPAAHRESYPVEEWRERSTKWVKEFAAAEEEFFSELEKTQQRAKQ